MVGSSLSGSILLQLVTVLHAWSILLLQTAITLYRGPFYFTWAGSAFASVSLGLFGVWLQPSTHTPCFHPCSMLPFIKLRIRDVTNSRYHEFEVARIHDVTNLAPIEFATRHFRAL